MPDPRDVSVYALLSGSSAQLLLNLQEVSIKTAWADDGAQFHPDDLNNLFGKQCRNAQSIRVIVKGIGVKLHRRFDVVIDDDNWDEVTPPPGARSSR